MPEKLPNATQHQGVYHQHSQQGTDKIIGI